MIFVGSVLIRGASTVTGPEGISLAIATLHKEGPVEELMKHAVTW